MATGTNARANAQWGRFAPARELSRAGAEALAATWGRLATAALESSQYTLASQYGRTAAHYADHGKEV